MQHLTKWSLKIKDSETASKYDEIQKKQVLKTLILMNVLRILRAIYVTILLRTTTNQATLKITWPFYIKVNFSIIGI